MSRGADTLSDAVGEHVVTVLAPFARRTARRGTLEDQLLRSPDWRHIHEGAPTTPLIIRAPLAAKSRLSRSSRLGTHTRSIQAHLRAAQSSPPRPLWFCIADRKSRFLKGLAHDTQPLGDRVRSRTPPVTTRQLAAGSPLGRRESSFAAPTSSKVLPHDGRGCGGGAQWGFKAEAVPNVAVSRLCDHPVAEPVGLAFAAPPHSMIFVAWLPSRHSMARHSFGHL